MNDMRQLSEEIKRILRSPYRVGLKVGFLFPSPWRICRQIDFAQSTFCSLDNSPPTPNSTRTTQTEMKKQKEIRKRRLSLYSRVTMVIRKPSAFSTMPIRMHCKSGLAVIHARLMDLQRPFLMAPNSHLSHWALSDFCVC